MKKIKRKKYGDGGAPEFNPQKRNQYGTSFDKSAHAPSDIDQATNMISGLGSLGGPEGQAVAAAAAFELPAYEKRLSGKSKTMTSMENAFINLGPLSTDKPLMNLIPGYNMYNAYKGYKRGQANPDERQSQQRDITNNYNTWANKQQKPYDKEGFYQLAKYGIGVHAYKARTPRERQFMASGGGIHIKPENKGKFNATKLKTGKTTEELTHSSNPVTKKRAIFAQNAKKWNHKAMGGPVDSVPIEAEGNETYMYPNGRLEDIKGPSHEQGGVKMNAKEGSKIYSDRIKARKDLIERFKNI